MPVWPILEDSKSAVLSLWWMKKERKKERKKEKKKEGRKEREIRREWEKQWKYQKTEKQKIILYQKYLYINREEITKLKNNEIMNSKDIDKKLKSEIYQIFYSSSYKQATRQANK